MRRLLIILLLACLCSYSYAGQEEDKAKVIIIDPDEINTNLVYDWPLWLYNHGYVSFYDSNWRSRGGQGAIVLRKPPSFGESFLKGFSEAFSKSTNYYYRKKEQDQYTKTMLKLLESPPVPKYTAPNYDEMGLGELIAIGLKKGFISDPIEIFKNFDQPKEYKMFPEERQANRERIIELDRIIEQKHKKREKLNEYIKSMGLPKIPDGFVPEWIYWNGKEWVKKKKEVNHEDP